MTFNGPTVRVETAANGSGTVVPAQNLTSGSSTTVFAISRDASGVFVANVAATWSLAGITGGVVSGDLVPAGDSKSATLTGHLVGSAVIHVISGTLNPVKSGTITVVVGTATKLAITSVNGGSNPTAGTPFSVVVQSQDANGNPANVTPATGVSLSLNTGTGTLGGTVSGTISNNTNSVTISGVTYNRAESGVILTVARTSGMTPLASGSSPPFVVTPGTATKLVVTGSGTQTAGAGRR